MKWSILFLLLVVATSIIRGCVITSKKPPHQSLQNIPKDWKKVELEEFYFYLPPDMRAEEVHGTDSEVWEFHLDNIRLSIDFGYFSDDLKIYGEQPGYREELVTIDGREAKICSFQLGDLSVTSAHKGLEFISAIYFSDTGIGARKLTLWANCRDASAQETAKIIFRSIKFKEEK